MRAWPSRESVFVAGRPYVYCKYYPNVNGAYIGRNDTGNLNYQGSPSDEVKKRIADAHRLASAPVEWVKRCMWSPEGAIVAETHVQEFNWIARFRTRHDGPVFNVFPVEDGINDFDWSDHDVHTHVDRGVNRQWPISYEKLQAFPDDMGNCSVCGEPWGSRVSRVEMVQETCPTKPSCG